MAKKRTSLDSLFPTATAEITDAKVKTAIKSKAVSTVRENLKKTNAPEKLNEARSATAESTTTVKSKSDIVKQTVYLPAAVYEQLRQLAFEERKKMHDFLVEGLDRVFKDRGLKSYAELLSEDV